MVVEQVAEALLADLEAEMRALSDRAGLG